MNSKERFVRSKCDRCGKSTPANQNGIGDLFTLPHEWPAPLFDQGDFCERCVAKYNAVGWLRWFRINRPCDFEGIDVAEARRLCEAEVERDIASIL